MMKAWPLFKSHWPCRSCRNADKIKEHLRPDEEVYADPEKYFDQLIEINLDELEPHLNGPFTPDLATPISQMSRSSESKWLARQKLKLD